MENGSIPFLRARWYTTTQKINPSLYTPRNKHEATKYEWKDHTMFMGEKKQTIK